MTNTTDKYITIPASDLSGRELRAHPSGKRVPNPDYIEPERPITEEEQKLIAVGGVVANNVSITFPGDRGFYWGRIERRFFANSKAADREAAILAKEAGIW